MQYRSKLSPVEVLRRALRSEVLGYGSGLQGLGLQDLRSRFFGKTPAAAVAGLMVGILATVLVQSSSTKRCQQ